jgi:hypothetical protein
MKKLVWRLVIPLTVISFTLFTKWWHTLPVDAPDTVFTGFPFPYVCNGWHTSMSLQVFVLEFISDLLIYFVFWFTIIFFVNRYIKPIKVPNILAIVLLSITLAIAGYSIWIASFKDNIFYTRRNFDMEIIKTGYKFIWQDQPGTEK